LQAVMMLKLGVTFSIVRPKGAAGKVDGAPDRIRTCGLCLRRATLYPAELRVLALGLSDALSERQDRKPEPSHLAFR
jgi:hypothetical protein